MSELIRPNIDITPNLIGTLRLKEREEREGGERGRGRREREREEREGGERGRGRRKGGEREKIDGPNCQI